MDIQIADKAPSQSAALTIYLPAFFVWPGGMLYFERGMKKILIVVLAATSVIACKPRYKCYCTRPGNTDTTFNLGKMSSTDAKTTCDGYNRNNPAFSCGVTE